MKNRFHKTRKLATPHNRKITCHFQLDVAIYLTTSPGIKAVAETLFA